MTGAINKLIQLLDLDITSFNEKHILILLCLLAKEPDSLVKLHDNIYDLCEEICNVYINYLETNTFVNLTEEDIRKALTV